MFVVVSVSYRSFTVNWTPVFSTRGLCGWVGMQGCLSTTRELHTHSWVRLIINNKVINNLCVKGCSLGEEVFEEIQSSRLQVSFFLSDGVAVVGELLLQLQQLLQVLTDLLEALCYCREPAGGAGGGERGRRCEEEEEVRG